MENKQEKSQKKIGFGRMFAWQSRAISQGANMLICGFLTIYCTDTLKVPAALVGLLLMVSKITDCFTTIIAGYFVDRTNTKLGRGRPYELAIVGMWLCTWLLFACPTEFSMYVKAVWIFTMYTFVNSIFSAFLSSNNTVYMVRAFSRQEDYVAISTYGGLIPILGAIIVNVTFPMMMAKMASSAQGWSTLIAIYAIPLCLIGLLRFLTIKETNNVFVNSSEKINFKDIVILLKTNPYIYILALMMFVFNFITNMGVGQYYYTYVVKNLSLMGIVSLTTVIVLPTLVVFPALIKKFSTTKLIQAGLVVTSVGLVINFFALDNPILLILGTLISGIGTVPISMLNALMIIDCAEYNEWKDRPRMEGTLNSIVGFNIQLGSAFGTGIMGLLLSMSGYTGVAATMPGSAIIMIRLLFSLIPMALYLIVILVLRFYKLDKLMPQIHKENEEKRAVAMNAGTGLTQ
jgi:probable glucitol transport protein GutA